MAFRKLSGNYYEGWERDGQSHFFRKTNKPTNHKVVLLSLLSFTVKRLAAPHPHMKILEDVYFFPNLCQLKNFV